MTILRMLMGPIVALVMGVGLAQAADAPQIKIETRHGIITIATRPDAAPNTVARITQLAREGFYNGVVFHRVVPNFVVQGGDPTGTGSGGSGQKLKAEFSDLKHEVGTVAMARSSSPDSADSQFYISLGRLPHLDHQYTIFGQVTDGMDAVRKIIPGDTMDKVTVSD